MTTNGEIAPLRVISKIRNNRMIRAREELKLSAPDMAAAVGVSYVSWIELESLRATPLRAGGGWRDVALRIADWLKGMPEDVWPAEALAVERTTVEVEVSASDALLIMGAGHQEALPDYRAEIEVDGLELALCSLTPKEELVLRRRFGLDGEEPETLDQIGASLEVSRTRISQIERKALRKLRHPSRARYMKIVDEAPVYDDLVSGGSDPSIQRCSFCRSPLTRNAPTELWKCGCRRTVAGRLIRTTPRVKAGPCR